MDSLDVVPPYLDQSFFDGVVRHMEKDSGAKVSRFEILPATKPGVNVASAVFRSSVTFKSKYTKNDKTISVIIKVKPVMGPELEVFADIIEKVPFFPNEMKMYGKVLPEIQSLLSLTGDKDILSPQLIYQASEPNDVIVLEDVSVDGFTEIDKPPEDFEVSKKIVERLAKFHAANFFLISENKVDPTEFNNYSVFENKTVADMIFTKKLETFAKVLQGWKGYDHYIPRIEKFSKIYLEKLLKTYKPNQSDSGSNVLNHADFHVRNLLFKKNANGKIEDLCILDYQICAYATPAIDLIYALYYFLTSDNRQKHRDEFIMSYHKQFVSSLKQFGYLKAPPSLIDLQIELLKHGHLEVLLCLCNTSFIYVDGTEDVYNCSEYKSVIEKELPRFLHNGFI